MNVKQLYEILGKYVDAGAGEWVIHLSTKPPFNRKQHRDWLKSEPRQVFPLFVLSEVIFAEVHDDVSDDVGKCAVLCPAFFIKDQNKAMYYLPSEDFVKAKAEEWNQYPLGKPLELAAKTSKGSKKGTKKSARSTKGSKKQ